MTLGDFVRMVRTNLRLIFIFGSLGLLLGFIQAVRQPVQYTATSLGFVVSSAGELDAGSIRWQWASFRFMPLLWAQRPWRSG